VVVEGHGNGAAVGAAVAVERKLKGKGKQRYGMNSHTKMRGIAKVNSAPLWARTLRHLETKGLEPTPCLQSEIEDGEGDLETIK
jgi:hypothetical protein